MRIRAALVLAAGAAALLMPAQANAVATRPCDDGSAGIVVYSGSDIASVCAGPVAGYPKQVVDTVRDMRCSTTPDGDIRCEMDRFPPPPIR